MITVLAVTTVFALAAWFLSSLGKKPALEPIKYADKVRFPIFGGAELEVVPEDVADGSANADAALTAFLALGDKDRRSLEHAIFDYYKSMRHKTSGDDLVDIASPSEVWDHVDIRGIGLTTESNGSDVFVRVFGECEWEPEHGLQIVYRGGHSLARVGPEDGHLT